MSKENGTGRMRRERKAEGSTGESGRGERLGAHCQADTEERCDGRVGMKELEEERLEKGHRKRCRAEQGMHTG